jgi:cytoskeletal protein CcmA (bactofilin family)
MIMTNKRIILLIAIPLFLVFTIGFGVTSTAKAVEFDEDGIIEAGEVIDDDLFIFSETVEINGTVNGDVFTGGTVVKVNGTINGSLIAGTQVVHINGEVTGSVYAVSMTITLGPEAKIGRNFYFGGFNLNAEPGSYVGKDLLVGAYQALLSGQIGRDVHAGVGALEIDGSIGNDVHADIVGTSEGVPPYYIFNQSDVDAIIPFGLRVSEKAEIGGSLNYKSSENQAGTILISPPGGIDFEYDPQLDPQTPREATHVGPAALVGAWFVKRVRMFIALMFLGGLLVWQLPGLLDKVSDKVEKESLPSFGWGMVTIVVVYLGGFLISGLIIAGAIFFGVFTLGELSWVILSVGFSGLGLISAAFGLLVSYGSKLVVAYLVGKLLLSYLVPKFEGSEFWPLLIGVLLYTFLRAIPFGFGFVISVIVTLIGLGAMWLYYRDHIKSDVAKS